MKFVLIPRYLKYVEYSVKYSAMYIVKVYIKCIYMYNYLIMYFFINVSF